MARGGKRLGAGRKKQERVVDGNVARRIKARLKAEELWVEMGQVAATKMREGGHTADLRQILEYLDDRDMGRTVQPIQTQQEKPLEVNVNIRRVGARN